jgi:hypothetical protein
VVAEKVESSREGDPAGAYAGGAAGARACRELAARPVTVLLRTGHMLTHSHGFDESAFARVVALLEGG